MLGRLLNTAASSLNPSTYTSKSATPLESATEEEHTRNLLFPDATLLQHSQNHAYPLQASLTLPVPSTASGFDDRGGLELNISKDFRIVIAQDALGDRDEPCALFDTQSSSESVPYGLGLDQSAFEGAQRGHTRNTSSGRTARGGWSRGTQSLPSGPGSTSPKIYQKPNNVTPTGAFCPARLRSSTLSSIPSDAETYHSRMLPEMKDETKTLMSCMFGSSAFSYKGPSTKMHILSSDGSPLTSSANTSPISSRELENHGPRDVQKRAPMSRASTYGTHPTGSNLSSTKTTNDLKTHEEGTVPVLLTRMFAVNLPEVNDSESHDQSIPLSGEPANVPDFPFPELKSDYIDGRQKRKKIKEKKTPMYAVGIVIQLPLTAKARSRPPSASHSRSSTFLSPNLLVPSSFESNPRSPWGLFDTNAGLLSPTSAASVQLDDRIEIIVDHFDTIGRTLSVLEKEASKEILALLKKADLALPNSTPKPAKEPRMQRTNQRIVQLSANALIGSKTLRDETKLAVQRLSSVLRIPFVITGQGRWGVWREEARWIGRWAGGREQNFFFFNLLTSFLGNHTEWLSSLAPGWYKRRHHQQKAHQDAEPAILHRTVIVSKDKMAARRLVFLLSAFLPAKHRSDNTVSPSRPGTSASIQPTSQSPPNTQSIRHKALLRTLNRRVRSNLLSVNESGKPDRSDSDASLEDFTNVARQQQFRRDSDARSIGTANLPIPSNDLSRKSSATTTSTATPFASPQAYINAPRGMRSGSSESLASANLLQTLKRSESSNVSMDNSDSHAGSRWANLISGVWSSRQQSSTDPSEVSASSLTDMAKGPLTQFDPSERKMNRKLKNMVEEVGSASHASGSENVEPSESVSIPVSSVSKQNVTELIESPDVHATLASPRRVSPLKLLVDEEDGVIDIELPFGNSLSSSGETSLTSIKRTQDTSVSSLAELHSVHSHASSANFSQKEQEGSLNVAGWLKQYHEDFSLQSVRPYAKLREEIEKSMLAQATPMRLGGTTPAVENGHPEKWVNVAITLIADSQNFSIKRLRLRRKVRSSEPNTIVPSAANSRPTTPYPESSELGSLFAYAARQRQNEISQIHEDVEEQFIEEPVMDLDGTLVDAVERVLARSGQSSKVQSRASSPARELGNGAMPRHTTRGSNLRRSEGPPSLEIPRGECKRMVVGALEQVVLDVTAERNPEERGREITGGDRQPSRSRKAGISADNALREGIRSWLQDVEETV